jgi:hypothetical protein
VNKLRKEKVIFVKAMRYRILPIFILLLSAFSACSKDSSPPTSGTVTIDNTTQLGQTYYVYGFLFSQGKKVPTSGNPQPDITIDNDGTQLLMMANNLKNSFFKAGEYPDGASAKSAYDNLKSATVGDTDWIGIANGIVPNQVWIYRSGTTNYAKFRIISTVAEVRAGRNYAECTLEWEYQPDGTLTFPGK